MKLLKLSLLVASAFAVGVKCREFKFLTQAVWPTSGNMYWSFVAHRFFLIFLFGTTKYTIPSSWGSRHGDFFGISPVSWSLDWDGPVHTVPSVAAQCCRLWFLRHLREWPLQVSHVLSQEISEWNHLISKVFGKESFLRETIKCFCMENEKRRVPCYWLFITAISALSQ